MRKFINNKWNYTKVCTTTNKVYFSWPNGKKHRFSEITA